MIIRFRITFSDGHWHGTVYYFTSFDTNVFDMVHFNDKGQQIDSSTFVASKTVRQAMKDLVKNAKTAGAKVRIMERGVNVQYFE